MKLNPVIRKNRLPTVVIVAAVWLLLVIGKSLDTPGPLPWELATPVSLAAGAITTTITSSTTSSVTVQVVVTATQSAVTATTVAQVATTTADAAAAPTAAPAAVQPAAQASGRPRKRQDALCVHLRRLSRPSRQRGERLGEGYDDQHVYRRPV